MGGGLYRRRGSARVTGPWSSWPLTGSSECETGLVGATPLGAYELGSLSLVDKIDRVSLSLQIMTHEGLGKENIKERKESQIYRMHELTIPSSLDPL